MGATNRPNDLDQAILRRMPATFHIALPILGQRKKILQLILANEPTELTESDYDFLAKATEGFSGSDLRELCRNATIYRVRDFMKTVPTGASGESLIKPKTSDSDEEFHDALRPITIKDLQTSLNKMKESKVYLLSVNS